MKAQILAVGFALLATAAHAQSDRLATVLERAAAASDAQQQFLPNFECREDVIAQRIHKGKVEEEGRMSAMLRVQRDATANSRLDESYVPLSDSATRGSLPWYVVGGFGLALEYVTREHQACYLYTLSGNRLEFKAKPHDQLPQPTCARHEGITGFATVNADGDITHIERHVPEKEAFRTGFVPWAAIDITTVTLDGREFRLSQHIDSVSEEGKNHNRFQATYSGCRLFGATITIHSGAPVDTPPDPAQGAKPSP